MIILEVYFRKYQVGIYGKTLICLTRRLVGKKMGEEMMVRFCWVCLGRKKCAKVGTLIWEVI